MGKSTSVKREIRFQQWIQQVKGGTVYLDGFRVYNTLESSKDEAKADEVSS